ncbi:MAG: NAD(P)-binding protein [bacterium]|nr:NAD(P)-binding protein [bacterium]
MDAKQLEQMAWGMVEGVSNSPQGRYDLRKAFYDQYGYGLPGHTGLGNSELAFMEWEIRRGLLNPLDDPQPGSPWWRAVNSQFIYYSTLAGLAFENGLLTGWPQPVLFWIDFISKPNPTHWYRAHNRSILEGYRQFVALATEEPKSEQAFTNIVLYRLLYAQAMVEDSTLWGDLGRFLANPRLPAVDFITSLPDFYPEHYPMTAHEFREVLGEGWGFEDALVRLMDKGLILPKLNQLYQEAARWNEAPYLMEFIAEGQPIYPDLKSNAKPNILKPKMAKQKIAILGGGLSALSAAFELTSYDNWQEDYEITLYQLGWRCGGKMRTGRGPKGRDEELGLHLLIGFEQNLFDLLRACWNERTAKGLAPDCPYKTLDEAIEPNNGSLFTEWLPEEYRWSNWPFIFPVGPGQPCEGPPLTGEDLIKRGVALLLEMLLGSPYARHFSPLVRWLMSEFFPPSQTDSVETALKARPSEPETSEGTGFFEGLEAILASVTSEVHGLLRHWQGKTVERPKSLGPWLIELIPYLVDLLQALEALMPKILLKDSTIRHLAQAMSMGLAVLKGLVEDVYDPKTGQWNFSNIDDQDFRAWIKAHGCADYALFSPLVQFAYQGAFAGLADGKDQGGLISAGAFLKTMAPAMGYKASFLYQPVLGTGDTLVMPIYQTLASRGVKFEFFSKVLDLIPDGRGGIGAVLVERQVSLKSGSYRPEVLVKGTPCWPSEPLWDQLDPAQAEELQAQGIDLESPWADWKGPKIDRLVAGQDFDQVILGIPAAAQKSACKTLVEQDPRWATMVHGLQNQAVTGVQFWYDKTLAEMGYRNKDWGMADSHCLPNVITYQNPLFSFIDQSYIIANEDWPATEKPKTLIMFAGYVPDFDDSDDFEDHQFPAREKQRLKELTWQWMMDNMGFFFKSDAPPAYPTGVDMGNLTPLSSAQASAKERYLEQWFSPIIAPSDRYNLTIPGQAKNRLPPGASGYANLFLVGDWTDYGNNMGYMEGTVVSGYKGAQALRSQALGKTTQRAFFEDPFFT